MKAKYNHTTTLHNLNAPREIVPIVVEVISPKSVVDIGCGLGTFLRVFKENGVNDILGIDGSWCKKELLFQNINASEFLEKELEQTIKLERKFDLAVCLEVAEHLTPDRADTFVKDLTGMSNVVLFSAAIPKQGGINHYNEQWIDYWEEKFRVNGFIMHDLFRAYLWNNDKVFSYYKQNMVLFAREGYQIKEDPRLKPMNVKNVVHPDLYLRHNDHTRKEAIKRFAKLFARAVKYKYFESKKMSS